MEHGARTCTKGRWTVGLAFLQTFHETNCLYFSAASLVLYDYALTIGDEYCYMWSTRISFASGLYYALRYSAVMIACASIISTITYASWPGWLVSLHLTFSILAFVALRMYAIYDRNKLVYAFVLSLSLVNPILTMYSFVVIIPQVQPLPDNQNTCLYNTRISERVIGGRAASICADVVVLLLTWWRMRPHSGADKRRLHGLMLMDSTILTIVNAVSIAVSHVDTISFTEPFTIWAAMMTSILLSRLTLNLRGGYASEDGTTYSNTFTSMVFAARTGGIPDEYPADEYLDESSSDVEMVRMGENTEEIEAGPSEPQRSVD
ncbi:uncharacterized protein LAESUDRAFT_725373 [Laetiporus sulphureus 93-53]|uniref:DUF6533 domain-containing protein n=1 Tax=Laetiporus sulphureus 93-53 TaxID=1314785 RepID=A0A165EH13_9APHY|nr:uncharacterized protein LAESUDRAFT_725373 [Laetiporus sulphureus 93-53]KZT07035.1 hypothetical protein LAESUDRAFT_725373 [Laetiporus sulphureus 93-53]